MAERRLLLDSHCAKYKDPFRIEHLSLVGRETVRVGAEVVHMRTSGRSQKPIVSVCIPHKVGSHAWGQFASKPALKLDPSQLDLSWQVRAELSYRAVVVRHPLERLLSVYRMIFEDWCDEKRFLAQQWNNVCVTPAGDDGTDKGFIAATADNKKTKFSAIDFLYSMADEQRHGNDRYIQKIWQKFNPGQRLLDPKNQLKFTFSQFVRFIVNGSQEFPSDVVNYPGLSYHWAPYWTECTLCSNKTRPHTILHMETLEEDLDLLLVKTAGHPESVLRDFPHTHSQAGGPSGRLAAKYYSQLSKSQVNALYEMYKVDHELFGYSPDPFLYLAQ
jgi:hypothetical protein